MRCGTSLLPEYFTPARLEGLQVKLDMATAQGNGDKLGEAASIFGEIPDDAYKNKNFNPMRTATNDAKDGVDSTFYIENEWHPHMKKH